MPIPLTTSARTSTDILKNGKRKMPTWNGVMYLVMDPFSGTFTTCFVAKELGRNFIGIELQDEYVKIGLRRLQLAKEFKGEKLQKEIRTFETEKLAAANTLQLFEGSNGKYIHSKH